MDKLKSVFYAQLAINGFVPFAHTVSFAKKWKEVAEGILEYWEKN